MLTGDGEHCTKRHTTEGTRVSPCNLLIPRGLEKPHQGLTIYSVFRHGHYYLQESCIPFSV